MTNKIEVETLHLFPILDEMLLSLLRALTPQEWEAQTVASLWKVKDVAAHLLDGNLRGLSMSRDKYFGETPGVVHTPADLIRFLNGLNMSWTSALKRLSPEVLISLLTFSGREYSAHLKTLAPFEQAIFPVAWAGQNVSPNWFHIAREYTEKFLHQQQIRDATGRHGLMTRELFYPFIDTLMFALPYTFRAVEAEEGTSISIIVSSEIGGRWNLVRTAKRWELNKDPDTASSTLVRIDPDPAWKLFSKSWSPEQVLDSITIEGNQRLGEHALRMVSVMA